MQSTLLIHFIETAQSLNVEKEHTKFSPYYASRKISNQFTYLPNNQNIPNEQIILSIGLNAVYSDNFKCSIQLVAYRI